MVQKQLLELTLIMLKWCALVVIGCWLFLFELGVLFVNVIIKEPYCLGPVSGPTDFWTLPYGVDPLRFSKFQHPPATPEGDAG